jgi:hypothetical protein
VLLERGSASAKVEGRAMDSVGEGQQCSSRSEEASSTLTCAIWLKPRTEMQSDSEDEQREREGVGGGVEG